MDEGAFEVVIIGTGLTESIIAAALSKAGFKVAHIDENPYYGGGEASLSLEEFIQWIDDSGRSGKLTSITRSDVVLPQSRQYAISLAPSVITSIGPFISSLVSSGVSRYGGFRLVEHIGVFESIGKVRTVPSSKEDVFKDKTISLVDKRRLMRFLMFAAGEFEEKQELEGKAEVPFVEFLKTVFSLKEEVATTIAYALSHCVSPSDTTLPALQRLRRYLKSTGRYGASPFLVGHYGSAGEISQGFCRTSAVSGGVYILGKTISSVTCNPPPEEGVTDSSPRFPVYTIHLSEFPSPLTCDLIISSRSQVSQELARHIHQISPASSVDDTHLQEAVARCVAIIDAPLSFLRPEPVVSSPETDVDEDQSSTAEPPSQDSPMDTGMLVFPPTSLPNGLSPSSVTVLIVGEGTLSTPRGKWIVYISTPVKDVSRVSAETLLKPYLDATLSLSSDASTSISPLFTAYYFQHSTLVPAPSGSLDSSPSGRSPYLIVPQTSLHPLPELPDVAAINAEAVYWEAVRVLRSYNHRPEGERGDEEGRSFWPPLPTGEEDEEEF